MRNLACIALALGLLCGCSDDDSSSSNTAGSGGTGVTGAGGATATGAGGATATGAGGATATGAGGATATGAGGATATGGAGMMATGGAGTMATGAGGAGGGGLDAPGCESADTSAAPADLHAAALAVLTPETPCAFASCHVGPNGKAGLVLEGATDLSTLLVDVTSCEAPNLPLVDSAGGDAGLENSWLWLKMTAPIDATGELMADPAWGTPGNCGQPVGSHGLRMPYGSTSLTSEGNLGPVRNWICAGAPGPDGT
ncbi:MAG: hypothetical protein PVI30_07795 [Myxococcales bacterium]|jgi:hypothetical protein